MPTLAIAPRFTNSKVRLTVSAMIANEATAIARRHTMAVFQDSVADAVAARLMHKKDGPNANLDEGSFHDVFILDAVNTDPRTYKVRMGSSSGTLYVNRASRVPDIYGAGKVQTVLTAEEIGQ